MLTEEEVPFTKVDKLVHAVQFGDYAFVETALATYHVSPDTKDAQNCSLLHWAAINNRVKIAELLISYHANVNIVGGDGEEIPLQWAVRYAKCLPIVYLLVQEKSNLAHLSNTHHDALFLAVIAGQLQIAFLLLNAGANPDTTDKFHDTPVLWLLKHRNCHKDTDSIDMMRLLLSFHADVSHNGKHGNNALHVLGPCFRDLNLDLTLLLYESGGDRALLSKNEMGKTPWQAAWSAKNLKLLRFYWDAYFYTKYPRILPMVVSAMNLTVLFQALQYFGWIYGLLVAGMWVLVSELFGQAAIFIGHSRASCGLAWGIILNAVGAYYIYVSPFYSSAFNYFIMAIVATICYSLAKTMQTKPQQLSDKGIDARNTLVSKMLHAEAILNTQGEEIGRDFRLCTTCLVDKSQASIHCKKCNICVVGLDHHCPFVNNCVGRGNRRLFVIFTCSAALGCFLMAWTSWTVQQDEFCPVIAARASGWMHRFFAVQWCMLFNHPELRALFCITYMSFLSSLWIGGLFFAQVQMIFSETTTFESLRRHNQGRKCCTTRAWAHFLHFLMSGQYSIAELPSDQLTNQEILAANTAAAFTSLASTSGESSSKLTLQHHHCDETGICSIGHDHNHNRPPDLKATSFAPHLGFFGMMSQNSPHAYSPMYHGHGHGQCCDHDHGHGHHGHDHSHSHEHD
jgi:palmitoyltransferase